MIVFHILPLYFTYTGPKFTANWNPQVTVKDYILQGTQQNMYEHTDTELWYWGDST